MRRSALRTCSGDENRDRRNRHLRAGGRPPAAPRARDRRLRGGRAARRALEHGRGRGRGRRPTAIDTGFIVFNDRNYPSFEALLAELGVASQPSHMSFSVSDGEGRFEYSGTPWGLFARPAHLLSPTFLGMLRDWRRFNREARALIGMNGTAPSLGALARAAGLLAPLHRAPDRAPGLRRLVGRPGADVELPGQLHGRVLRQPRHVQPARPAAVADRRAAARAATSRRSRRRGATGCGWARRCGGSSGCRTGCGSRPRAARARSSTRS